MAMGIGLMFNIILPANFNSPYKSTNIQEFWKRWHMTLGRFMTNYLYIPLGGNRKGEVKTLRNLFIVFLASGIWHGAGWNFVIWGILHGICILIHRIWKNSGRKLNKIVGWLITMNLVNIFWIFFRAETVSSAMKVIKGMFDINNFYYISVNMNKVGEITKFYREIINETSYLGNKMDILILLISTIIIFEKNTQKKLIKFEPRYKYLVITLVNLNLSLLLLERVKVFLYFNF